MFPQIVTLTGAASLGTQGVRPSVCLPAVLADPSATASDAPAVE